jgi:hypothetical protein
MVSFLKRKVSNMNNDENNKQHDYHFEQYPPMEGNPTIAGIVIMLFVMAISEIPLLLVLLLCFL